MVNFKVNVDLKPINQPGILGMRGKYILDGTAVILVSLLTVPYLKWEDTHTKKEPCTDTFPSSG